MGFWEELFDAFDECCDDDWDYRESGSRNNGLSGRHRYVVNYIAQNGMPCGTEVLAFTNGQARDSVRCRSDVKYITSSYEV